MALMLANGYSPTQGLEIYRHNIPIIFNTNIFRRLAPFLSTYSNRHRQEVFEYYLGGLKLSDLGKHIVITAFRLDGGPDKKGNATFFPSGSWRPALMSNLPLASGLVPPDNDLECSNAAMRTTSAPTYFPIHQVGAHMWVLHFVLTRFRVMQTVVCLPTIRHSPQLGARMRISRW